MPAAPSSLIDNARVKLGRLREQIDAVQSSEHPNSDSQIAVRDLASQVDRFINRLNPFETYPAKIQSALLLRANFLIYSFTDLLGFLVRSTSTRNLFELYYPFLEVAKKLVDDDVHLILSSDWQFSPFTYPFNLDQLPNYILIGLPASESENVLLFPTAAHELGHNVWKAKDLAVGFKSQIEEKVFAAAEANFVEFQRVFGLKRIEEIRTDMFVQPIIGHGIRFATRQLEELYCDYTGLVLFGTAYVYAFDYLLAPTLGGRRGGEYPSSRQRVVFMERHAKDIGLDLDGLSSRFVEDELSGLDEINVAIKLADTATAELESAVFERCKEYIWSKHPNCLCPEKTSKAVESFRRGVPASDTHSLGDLLNAAWIVYNTTAEKGSIAARGVDLVPFITDLVIKSAEALEYRSFVNRA